MISLFICRKAEIDAKISKEIKKKDNMKRKSKYSPPQKKCKKKIGLCIIASLYFHSGYSATNTHHKENHEPIHQVPSHVDVAMREDNQNTVDFIQAQLTDSDQSNEDVAIKREDNPSTIDFIQVHLTDSDQSNEATEYTQKGYAQEESYKREKVKRSTSTKVNFSNLSPFKDSLKTPDLMYLQQSMHIAFSPVRPARILVLDGGGVRGLMELAFLEKLEHATGLKTAQIFHMIGGTSVGGKIATLLSALDPVTQEAKYSAGELKRIFLEKYKDMFSLKFKTLFGFLGEKYKTTPIRKMIDSLVGDQLFTDTIIPAFAVAYDLTATSEDKLKVFSTEEDLELKMKDVILATTAAPSYFKSHKIDGREYADGGLILNNPTVVAINEAHKHFPNATNYILVSLGTGIFPEVKHRATLRHQSIITLASEVPSFLLHGQNDAAREGLQFRNNIIPFRFTPIIHGKKIDLDDVSPKSIERMLKAVDQLWVNESVKLRQLLDILPHIHHNILV